PDPLSLVGVGYGAPYDDADDATTPELDAARVLVTLHDISVNSVGLYVLEGPHVKIIGENQAGTITYNPPQVTGPDEFRFTRNLSGFEAVNAYYHLDKSQRYVQSLGITDLLNRPFSVNPQGTNRDDSFFFPDRNLVIFGTGGVDDAEDASVLWHEYAHGLMEDGAPGLLSTLEGGSLHEGWADYWASSYLRHLAESGATVQQDWTRLFRWDSGDGFIWAGRVVDNNGHYPEDTCVDDPSPGICNKHNDGLLWATTLMEIYSDLGREITDELALRSLGYLSSPVTFRDAAEAVVQADLDYFAGSHVDILLMRFGARGLLDPGSYAPVITHDELSWTEFPGGTRAISAEVVGLSAPVDRVSLHYRYTSSLWMELSLTAGQSDLFLGELPLPTEADTVFYYFEAVDTGGLTSFLPDSAPVETFYFGIGEDTEAPVIAHEPESRVALAAWPASIQAQITDNLGIARVEVAYRISNNFNLVLAEGTFELSGSDDVYSGVFPVASSVLESHNQVLYSIEATDASVAGNRTRMPETGYYLMSVDAEGVFREFDFEAVSPLVEATGVWDQGVPRFGLQAAHSGEKVFGTATGSAYPAIGGLSTLTFASVNLSGVNGAMLMFWHWYDFEHDGAADPNVSGASLWDGGNVKVSTDGGQSWELLLPEGHYSGDVIVSQENPLSGQRAFGGYSYGWRQEIMQLPEASDVRIRFDVGTDDSNTQDARWYAGWYIDDVAVTTIRPEDSAAPSAIDLPPARSVLSINEPAPRVEVELTDDNGVADAYFRYEYMRTN
ncbi:MAG: hypothetical protein IIA50_06020, partial [Bacteroidetes bacterium]|nr:hypothetical protein [Bacteroidota bacterium]